MLRAGAKGRHAAIVRALDVPVPFDLGQFVAGLERQRDRLIRLRPFSSRPGCPCGLWIGTANAGNIYHEAGTTPFHATHIAPHELAHMLLGGVPYIPIGVTSGWPASALGVACGVASVIRVWVGEAVEPGPRRMVWFPRAKEAAGGRSSWGCVRPAGCVPGVVWLTMPGGRLGRILAELSAGGQGWSAARLCGVCPGIAGVTGAGVMLMSGEIPRGSLCTTDEVSHLIEDLQYTLGEGPCVDAYRQDTVVAEPDLADPVVRRWPAFASPALRAGARAVFGFPLRVGTVRLGALNLYRDRPGPLSGDHHADALVVADVAARWVLEAQAGAAPDTVAEELEAGADFHFVVHNAAGMVSVQAGISVTEALIRLRAFAFSSDRLLAEVAGDVVARRLRLG